jgi:mRNA interferase MazF
VKDFAQWHQLKTFLESHDNGLYFHEGEVWLASVGLNLGHEQDGKREKFLRPVLVVRKFYEDAFLGVPLTNKEKFDVYHSLLRFGPEKSFAILSQIRFMDRKRLFRIIGTISKNDLAELKEKIKRFL